jgi:two-component system, response regulator / RNA-binding antiterminator
MLQSFVLIEETPSPGTPGSAAALAPPSCTTQSSPSGAEETLKDLGFRVSPVSTAEELALQAAKADAFVLAITTERVGFWRTTALGVRSLPVFWWCDRRNFPNHGCTLDPGIDGMLGESMSELEIHCALLLGMNHYFRRTEWEQEREQLLSRLEERKWIDQAKRILSEVKGISEAEAYDFLRKQAMNERKRMVDVATSIVTVYQLLQAEPNQGGRKR